MITWFEKRRHHRLTAALQLFYERTDLDDIKSELHKGYTENISMGGIYFISHEAPVKNLNVNDILSINIKIPRHNYDLSWTNTLQARGKIVRIDKVEDRPESFGIALKFLEDLRFINS
jgi:PilZ domain